MEQLIVRGENLDIARNVIKAMPGYTVVKQIVDNDELPKVFPITEGTCSACPHFTRIEGTGAEHCLWGECSKYKANVGMYKPHCKSFAAEIEVKRVEEV